MFLQLIFGMSMTEILDYLNFCMHVLVRVLMGIDEATVRIPQEEIIHSSWVQFKVVIPPLISVGA